MSCIAQYYLSRYFVFPTWTSSTAKWGRDSKLIQTGSKWWYAHATRLCVCLTCNMMTLTAKWSVQVFIWETQRHGVQKATEGLSPDTVCFFEKVVYIEQNYAVNSVSTNVMRLCFDMQFHGPWSGRCTTDRGSRIPQKCWINICVGQVPYCELFLSLTYFV